MNSVLNDVRFAVRLLSRNPVLTLVAVLSLALIVWLLLHSTLQEAKVAALAAGVGLFIYLSYWLYSRSS